MRNALQKVRWRSHVSGFSALSVSLLVCIVSVVFYLNAQEDLANTKRSLMQVKSQIGNARSQLQIFNEYFPQYKALFDQGVIGKTKRLQWLETLQSTSQNIQIPSVEFSVNEARTAEDMRDHLTNMEVKTEITSMELSLRMIHEGEWYQLLRALHENALGVFSTEKCILINQNVGKSDAYLRGFIATCDLEWYTLNDVRESWPQ